MVQVELLERDHSGQSKAVRDEVHLEERVELELVVYLLVLELMVYLLVLELVMEACPKMAREHMPKSVR